MNPDAPVTTTVFVTPPWYPARAGPPQIDATGYARGMLLAKRTSVWRTRYEVSRDGHPIAHWDGSLWRSGGDLEVAGHPFEVRGNAWGSRFSMLDKAGGVVASADRVGRKRWTVTAGGLTYHFQR